MEVVEPLSARAEQLAGEYQLGKALAQYRFQYLGMTAGLSISFCLAIFFIPFLSFWYGPWSGSSESWFAWSTVFTSIMQGNIGLLLLISFLTLFFLIGLIALGFASSELIRGERRI